MLGYECVNSQTTADIDSFKKAMMPAVEWMRENGNPHMKAIIHTSGAELVSGEMAFEVEVEN